MKTEKNSCVAPRRVARALVVALCIALLPVAGLCAVNRDGISREFRQRLTFAAHRYIQNTHGLAPQRYRLAFKGLVPEKNAASFCFVSFDELFRYRLKNMLFNVSSRGIPDVGKRILVDTVDFSVHGDSPGAVFKHASE